MLGTLTFKLDIDGKQIENASAGTRTHTHTRTDGQSEKVMHLASFIYRIGAGIKMDAYLTVLWRVNLTL